MSARQKLKFLRLAGAYTIVQLPPDTPVPAWAAKGEFTSITRAANELSIVCQVDNLPPDVDTPHRWVCLKLEGPFPFSQTGVLLSFIEPLSTKDIAIFAISTYDTDFVFIQEEFVARALAILRDAGHEFLSAK